MTLPVLNVPLLRSLVTWAYADEQHDQTLLALYADWGSWDQGSWHQTSENEACTVPTEHDPMSGSQCGSSYCIAGQAVAQVGYRLNLIDFGSTWDNVNEVDVTTSWRADYAQPVAFDGLDEKGFPTYRSVGDAELIPDIAKRALGLESREGDNLFEASNSIDKIAGLALAYAAARGVSLRLRDEIDQRGRDWLSGYNANWERTPFTEVFGLYLDDASAYNEALSDAGLWHCEPEDEPEPEPEEYRVLFSVYVNALEHEDPESLARDLVIDDVWNMQHVETESAGSYF